MQAGIRIPDEVSVTSVKPSARGKRRTSSVMVTWSGHSFSLEPAAVIGKLENAPSMLARS
jgi:hypothetical protein